MDMASVEMVEFIVSTRFLIMNMIQPVTYNNGYSVQFCNIPLSYCRRRKRYSLLH